MIKIYFNSKDPELIYAIVAIKEYYNNNDCSLLAGETVDCLRRYPPERNDSLFIINIGPRNEKEAVVVENFLRDHGHQIQLWIDKDKYQQVTWLQDDREIIQVYSEPSCLRELLELGYHVNERWIEMADYLASGDYTENYQLVRLYQAWYAARILQVNGEVDKFINFFQTAHGEIISDLRSREISLLNDAYKRIIDNTQQAQQKIINQPPFQGIIQREIGYADLGEINIEIDINKVIRIGKIRFPWLSITQYVYQGQQYTAVFSDRLKIKKLLGTASQTLTMDKQQAISFLIKKIKEWDKKTV